MNRVTFIVFEPSYLIRKGIVSIINRIEYASVIREADSLKNINSLIPDYNPDFVVINLELYNDYIQTRTQKIKTDLALKGIAIVTGIDSIRLQTLNFREKIFLTDSKEEIFQKISGIVTSGSDRKLRENLNELSEREKTILKHVAKGFTNKEIAEKLFLSTHTVITHRKNITSKLGIKTISGLTVYAILNNLISLEELKS